MTFDPKNGSESLKDTHSIKIIRDKREFEKKFHFYFPFVPLPKIKNSCEEIVLDHNNFSSVSSSIGEMYLSSCCLFGVEFVGSGVTKEDAQNLLYDQMVLYLKEFVKSLYDEELLIPKNEGFQSNTMINLKNKMKYTINDPNINDTATGQSSISMNHKVSFVSLLFEHSQKNQQKTPQIEFIQESNLFGCKITYMQTTYQIEPRFIKKTEAKEAACKHVLESLYK